MLLLFDIIAFTIELSRTAVIEIYRKETMKMKVKLVGRQPINFTNSEGVLVSGTSIYVLYESDQVEGVKADKFFLKSGVDNIPGCQIGDVLELYFNNKARIDKVEKIK